MKLYTGNKSHLLQDIPMFNGGLYLYGNFKNNKSILSFDPVKETYRTILKNTPRIASMCTNEYVTYTANIGGQYLLFDENGWFDRFDHIIDHVKLNGKLFGVNLGNLEEYVKIQEDFERGMPTTKTKKITSKVKTYCIQDNKMYFIKAGARPTEEKKKLCMFDGENINEINKFDIPNPLRETTSMAIRDNRLLVLKNNMDNNKSTFSAYDINTGERRFYEVFLKKHRHLTNHNGKIYTLRTHENKIQMCRLDIPYKFTPIGEEIEGTRVGLTS